MRITQIVLHHWRGIELYALEDIDPGLNLILGDNETGKSRIAEAIWFGLFESSKGKSGHKEALRSWEPTEDPKVEIDFEIGGNVYHLEKTFGQNTYKTKLYHGIQFQMILQYPAPAIYMTFYIESKWF